MVINYIYIYLIKLFYNLGANDIKNHRWFGGLNWNDLECKKI